MLTPQHIWLTRESVDMRRGIDTLTQYITDHLIVNKTPLSHSHLTQYNDPEVKHGKRYSHSERQQHLDTWQHRIMDRIGQAP